MKHGVSQDQVLEAITKMKSHHSFATTRKDAECMARLDQIEDYFFTVPQNIRKSYVHNQPLL
jgi:hypothetical protein